MVVLDRLQPVDDKALTFLIRLFKTDRISLIRSFALKIVELSTSSNTASWTPPKLLMWLLLITFFNGWNKNMCHNRAITKTLTLPVS
uniref:AlNc14C201G8682 protein n=1 Tax=Albugo laibachii Nc14 TaxID=890382 RepID=F0WQL5_9STRA|nr:AlNc14C201G8682 [Albugo laibachii Nc14]|eukprot:CCA23624.1 AlNc14C201G8682 [Albugo laibachii Nc14]